MTTMLLRRMRKGRLSTPLSDHEPRAVGVREGGYGTESMPCGECYADFRWRLARSISSGCSSMGGAGFQYCWKASATSSMKIGNRSFNNSVP